MSEEEIAGLMAGEIANDVCETVKSDCKARCEAVLRKIIIEGKGFELLNELSEADKRAVKENLRILLDKSLGPAKKTISSKPKFQILKWAPTPGTGVSIQA